MAVTYETFIQGFPEFATVDALTVTNTITQVYCETCGYEGLSTEAQQDCAISLHVAHLLTFYKQTQTKFNNGQKAIKYKSKQEEIQFNAGDPMNPFGMSQTAYGQRLEQMLRVLYVPFCL